MRGSVMGGMHARLSSVLRLAGDCKMHEKKGICEAKHFKQHIYHIKPSYFRSYSDIILE